jgi:ribosomal protein S18 acetylase RimI-like enzyme
LIYVDAAWPSVPAHAERDLDSWREKERRCRSMFLARRDGRPVGWVSVCLLHSDRGHISTLAVATGERGRGLGRALLLHAFSDLQSAGARGLALAVEADNETALGLYRCVDLGGRARVAFLHHSPVTRPGRRSPVRKRSRPSALADADGCERP